MSDTREKKRISTGAWIFLSVLVIVGAFFTFANMARENSQSLKQSARNELNNCLLSAENAYNEDLKLNATGSKIDENGKTIYTGNANTFDRLVDEKRNSDSLCHQNYGGN